MNIKYILSISLIIYSCVPDYNPDITSEDLKNHLLFMASDSLKGRYPGTAEDSVLLNYLASEFSKYKLQPSPEGYIQKFEIVQGIAPDENNNMKFGNIIFKQGEDFMPFGFSGDKKLSAPLVFCGFGFDLETEEIQRNDYSSIKPEGKWVLLFRGEPENNEKFSDYSSDRDKVMLAIDKGAAGVIMISGEAYSLHDDLIEPELKESAVDIPVVHMTRMAADKLLTDYKYNIKALEKISSENNLTNPEIRTEKLLTANIRLIREYDITGNAIGILPGSDPELKDEYVVFGAHHDHLGFGGQGSSSRAPDTTAVHYGADDNASGVASILELAAYYSGLEESPARSLVFVTFGAEEMGILGSRYFTENPVIDPEKINLMINLDMVGRMKADSSLQIGGAGTAQELKDIIRDVNENYDLNLKVSDAGYGPSDHASFYAKDIPVLFFSTGPHRDYHTPNDIIDSLNIGGIALITHYISEIADVVIRKDSMLNYTEAGPKKGNSGRYMKGVTLGIMPDVSGAESEGGMEVLAVTDGKPADLGGMKKGDIIIAIENKTVNNVYDYMYRLKKLKAGDQIIVTVKRDNETVDLLIQL